MFVALDTKMNDLWSPSSWRTKNESTNQLPLYKDQNKLASVCSQLKNLPPLVHPKVPRLLFFFFFFFTLLFFFFFLGMRSADGAARKCYRQQVLCSVGRRLRGRVSRLQQRVDRNQVQSAAANVAGAHL